MALFSVQEVIERTIFETIEKVIVDEGWGVKRDAYSTLQSYEVALKTIKDTPSKKFAIEIFGPGDLDSKGLVKVPRIVMETPRVLPGEIGSQPGLSYEKKSDNSGDYNVLELPPTTHNLIIDILLVSDSIKKDRLLNTILGKALSTRKYLKRYDKPVERFFMSYNGSAIRTDFDQGPRTRVLSYTISDIYVTESEIVGTASKINDITVTIKNENSPDETVEKP